MSFDIIRNIKNPHTEVCTPEKLMEIMQSESVKATCKEIAANHEKLLKGEMTREEFEKKKSELKKRLPAFCFHAHFKDGKRSNAGAEPSGLSILDIDHIDMQQEVPALSLPSPQPGGGMITGQATDNQTATMGKILKQQVLNKRPISDDATIAKLKSLGIVLVHLTPSCEGLRIVFKLQSGETLVQGQQRMAKALGLTEFDGACKDLARCSFAVPTNYVLFINEEALFADNKNTTQVEPNGDSAPTVPNGDSAVAGLVPATSGQGNQKSSDSKAPSGVVAGTRPATAQNLKMFDEVVKASGLKIDNLNNVGTRHNSLVAILSFGLNRLMSEDQLRAVIAERMPDYSKEKDCQDLIRDYYSKYYDPSKPMSARLRKIFTDSLNDNSTDKSTGNRNAQSSTLNAQHAEEDKEVQRMANLKKQKRIFKHLPMGLRESIEGLPDNMKMPVLCAIMPLAAAYADGVRVRYCDGQTQRLNLMTITVGPQASGKSACTAKVNMWLEQMEKDDDQARKIEEKWREECRGRKSTEKAPDNPHVLLRNVPVTISCSTLLKRFKNSRGHTIYSFGEELDTLCKTNKAGSWSDKYDVYRLGFDNGKWGQDYNSDQAESGIVPVAYNWTMLGTEGALHRCFRNDNVENGLSSRVIISEMPNAAFAKMPVFVQPSKDLATAIDQTVTKLRACSGFIDTPKLRKAVAKWVEAKRIEASADGDLVKDTYRKRAAVIGFRCGVVAMLIEGQESKNVLDFATMMAQYVLDNQIKYFGSLLNKEFKQASEEQERYSVNGSVFDALSPVFSIENLQALKPDTKRQALYTVLSRWKKDKWVEKIGPNQWKKVKAA